MNSKGFTIKGALAFVEKKYRPEGKAKVIAALDPESRKVAERLVLSSEWVPFRVQVALYEAIDRTFGTGDFSLCWDIGRFTSEDEMGTINLIFLRLGKLEHWFRAASMIQRTVELSGLKSVTVEHPECVLSGGKACEFRGHWDEN